MSSNYLDLAEFKLEGQFLGFVGNTPEKFKYLRFSSESKELEIKVPKELRGSLSLSLVPGQQIRVYGIGKFNSHKNTIKLKAYGVTPINSCPNQTTPSANEVACQDLIKSSRKERKSQALFPPACLDGMFDCNTSSMETSSHKSSPKAKILLCQKSGCLKRGGKSLLSELEQTLCDCGLQDKVTIEYSSRCMKCCKSAPNYILQIGNKEYKNIHPKEIASLLENHS